MRSEGVEQSAVPGPTAVYQLQLLNVRLALHALDLRRASRRIAHPAAAPRSVLFDKNLWGISERAVHEQSDRRCGGWGGWRVKLARLDQRGDIWQQDEMI